MLTPKQIKNLKPGAPILIHGTFTKLYEDGDIQYESACTDPSGKIIPTTLRAAHPSCVSLPEQIFEINPENNTKNTEESPKYDPCRKFRKGDKVRVVKYKGRCKKPFTLKVGDILRLTEDEANDDTFIAKCERNNACFYLDPAYLELVTPVEETEPFYVEENCGDWRVLNRKANLIASIYNELAHPHAKRAAESECACLNAEYRKENA